MNNFSCLDRFTKAQLRKADTLRKMIFISLGLIILIFLFELAIVQIFTSQRNAAREIHSHQFNLEQRLTCISRLVSMYYLSDDSVGKQLKIGEQGLIFEHNYLLSHSIDDHALKITESGEKIYNDLIYRVNLVIQTHPSYVVSNFQDLLDDSTTYATIITGAYNIYTVLFNANNSEQQTFLTVSTFIEIGILCLVVRFNIIPSLNSLLDSIFKFAESQENLAAEKRKREELVRDLPLHLSDVRVDVAQIGKNLYQIAGQDKMYTVEYKDGLFICEPSCSIFEHVHTCMHTRRARWFRNKLESSTSMEVFR